MALKREDVVAESSREKDASEQAQALLRRLSFTPEILEQMIDEQLQREVDMRNSFDSSPPPGRRYYSFTLTVPATASRRVLEEVTHRYRAAGWFGVIISRPIASSAHTDYVYVELFEYDAHATPTPRSTYIAPRVVPL